MKKETLRVVVIALVIDILVGLIFIKTAEQI